MNHKQKTERKTALILQELKSEQDLKNLEQPILDAYAMLDKPSGSDRFYQVFLIKEKKTGDALGFVHFSKADPNETAEIHLSLFTRKNAEKIAVDALRRACRRMFRLHKDLRALETWLNPDIPFIRILEKAGFERVFEKDGVIRYEKCRPRFPFLPIIMIAFTGVGILLGFLFNNYPLWVIIGIAAGVLVGGVAEKIASDAQKPKKK